LKVLKDDNGNANQQPVSLAKGFGDWEKHTRGIGANRLCQC
jgi:hypothetical protein